MVITVEEFTNMRERESEEQHERSCKRERGKDMNDVNTALTLPFTRCPAADQSQLADFKGFG